VEESQPGAVGRCPVNRKMLRARRLDPHSLVPGNGVTDTRLRRGRGHDDRLA
jgi:hypothetical protein